MSNQVPQDQTSSASRVSTFKRYTVPTKTIAELTQDEQARKEWFARVEQLRLKDGAAAA